MRDEREQLTPDEDAVNLEDLEDLDVSEDEAANVKGGGPREASTQTGGSPEDLR